MSHHFIEFHTVSYKYPDATEAIKEISLRITHGESVGIIGANGAGKSTLLMLITGLLLPASGEIQIGGIPVNKKTLTGIRRHVGYLFQNPDDQLFMNTVYEDIAFGLRNYGLDEQQVKERVLKILDSFGIIPLKDKPPYRLSGGEKSRAALAAVLALDPDILLLDEPASNLDPRSRRSLITLLNSFPHTKLITSHDLDFILDTCNRIIVLQNGRIVCDGNPVQVFQDEQTLHAWDLEKPLRLQACPFCNAGTKPY